MSTEGEAEKAFQEGLRLADTGDWAGALAAFDQVLKLRPDYPEAWLSRGVALDSLGRHQEALESYDEALRLKPDLPEAWLNRGIALGDLGRYQEALESYDEALRLRPGYPEAWLNRGAALDSLGRYKEALESYDEALRLRPGLPEAWLNRGLALVSLERFQEAVESYIKALEYKPDYPKAFEEIIEALKRLEKWLRDRRPPPLSVQCYEEVTATEKKLHDFLRQRLEEAFGKEETGWWVEGIPQDIRKKCAQRREEDPRRQPVYNYTDLIDLKDILDRNWRLFEADFQWVKSKVKSKREFLDNLVQLNEIRKPVMHPVRGGTLTEEDLDFVRRMRQVVENFAAPG
jgi:tetratricopeptide (TPR) repeat protein